MSSAYPIAVVCSDVHLSDKPPVSRSGEPDWFAAMERTLNEVNALAESHDIPVIAAGDIFDRPRVSPALEVFAARNLRGWYCIPGQHDLPNHRLDRLDQSSYGVLVLRE